jgi:hypothetical protein
MSLSGKIRKTHPVPGRVNKYLNIALFAKIRFYWALKTTVAKAV